MIENLSEFFKNFRERMASPFFFSFLVSWILINWRVTVALIWYNSELYPQQGDLIKFIEKHTSIQDSICYPLFYALLYTAVLRNGISALVEFSLRWGGNLNLSISKGSNVPMKKFLTYRDLYYKANKSLEKIIKDEAKTIENFDKEHQKVLQLESSNLEIRKENGLLKASNKELQSSHIKLTTQIESIQTAYNKNKLVLDKQNEFIVQYKNYGMLNGRWKFRYENKFRSLIFEEIVEIVDGVFYNFSGSHGISTLRTTFFFNDQYNGEIFLMLEFVPNTIESDFIIRTKARVETANTDNHKLAIAFQRASNFPIIFQKLRGDKNLLTGTENVEAIISYEKLGESRVIGGK